MLPEFIPIVRKIFTRHDPEPIVERFYGHRATFANSVAYLYHLRTYVAFLVWAIIFWFAFDYPPIEKFWSRGNLDLEKEMEYLVIFTDRLRRILMATALALLIEKIAIHRLAFAFHQKAFNKRIRNTNDAYIAVQYLHEIALVGKKKIKPESTFVQIAEETKASCKGFVNGIKGIFGAFMGMDVLPEDGLKLSSPMDVLNVSNAIYNFFEKSPGYHIELNDFLPWFSSKEEAKKAFDIFDVNGNDDISREEVLGCVSQLYRDCVTLDHSIRQSAQALDRLDLICLIIVYIILFFVGLDIWDNKSKDELLALCISLFAGLVFAIGDTIKSLVESCVFVFLTHPYDVGDLVEVDGNKYTVQRIGLTVTVFRRGDGRKIYAPNASLFQAFIHNVTRSGDECDSLQIKLSLNTPKSKLLDLDKKMRNFLLIHKRDYLPRFNLAITEIVDHQSMTVEMEICYRGNTQDFGKRNRRRNDFIFAFRDALQELEIEFAISDMDVNIHSTPTLSKDLASLWRQEA
jgi:small-conductance mechanosensitive channel